MPVSAYPDFFNDVFGPVMQPGSSGGFAAPVRIGNIARALVSGAPVRARVLVPAEYGSLSQLDTFMTDRGLVGGLLGFGLVDERLFDAPALARAAGLDVSFGHAYPGRLAGFGVFLVEVEDASGAVGRLVARSTGGGMVEVEEVNGWSLGWRADTFALVLSGGGDAPGRVARDIGRRAGEGLVAVRPLSPAVAAGGPPGGSPSDARAWVVELSDAPDAGLADGLSDAGLLVLPAQLPVRTRATRGPQLFSTVGEWGAYARERGITLAEAAIRYEEASSGWSRDDILGVFRLIAGILDAQIHAVPVRGAGSVAETPVLPVYSRQWEQYAASGATGGASGSAASGGVRDAAGASGGSCGRPLSDTLTARIIEYSLSVNAKVPGVIIVPGPMGTGGGYLFAALRAVQELRGYPWERLVESLAVAAGLGAIAFTHTVASGERGCVGESGVCCAMASGAVAYLAGGGAAEVEHAASMALQASFGITCDPIPGGREFPCLTRTVRAAVTAPLYADLALAGIDPLIPYHEVLQAIEAHYRATPPQLLCGSGCGCNVTPTARACHRWLDTLVNA